MSVPAVGLSNILMRFMRYRLWLVVFPLALGLATGIYSMLQLPVFTAYARLLPPQTNASSATALLNQVGGGAAVGAAALTLKNPSDLYASMLLSRTVQDDAIARFKLQAHYSIDDIDLARVEVAKRTKVEVGKDGIITLSYTDKTGLMAADVANGLIEAMYRVASRLARQDDARRMAFYDRLIEEARQTQEAADLRLLEVEVKTGLTRLKGQEESSTAAMVELRGMIATREVELAKSSVTATARHPEMVRLQSELTGLRAQLGRLEPRVSGKSGLPDDGVKKFEQVRRDKNLFLPFGDYAQRRALVDPARRDVENAQNVIAQLVKAREFSRGDDTRDLSVMQILDEAVAPTRKSGPKVVFNAVAATIVGFFFAVMAALAWDILFTDMDRRQRWRLVAMSVVRFRSKRNSVPYPTPNSPSP
jgi:tyrosine-protein kinase Etk/Wzc